MPHFPHHIGGGDLGPHPFDLVHGSTVGISQAGISARGKRVFIEPSRRRGSSKATEVRLRQTMAFSGSAAVTGADIGAAACGAKWLPGTWQWELCMLGAELIPGGDDPTIPGGNGDCPIPLIRDADGQCRQPGSPADIDVNGSMGGVAVMGRYGAALAPDSEMRLHRDCLPGMVLGKDNLCYNRRDIRNSERKYPRGARPLGTPGDMSALRKAASFGRRMETTVKRMQKIGVLKKPASRKAAPEKPKLIAAAPAITAVSVGE